MPTLRLPKRRPTSRRRSAISSSASSRSTSTHPRAVRRRGTVSRSGCCITWAIVCALMQSRPRLCLCPRSPSTATTRPFSRWTAIPQRSSHMRHRVWRISDPTVFSCSSQNALACLPFPERRVMEPKGRGPSRPPPLPPCSAVLRAGVPAVRCHSVKCAVLNSVCTQSGDSSMPSTSFDSAATAVLTRKLIIGTSVCRIFCASL